MYFVMLKLCGFFGDLYPKNTEVVNPTKCKTMNDIFQINIWHEVLEFANAVILLLLKWESVVTNGIKERKWWHLKAMSQSLREYIVIVHTNGVLSVQYVHTMILTWGVRQSGWWQHSGRQCWYRQWASPHLLGWWPGQAASAHCWWGWSSGGSQGYHPAPGQKAARTHTKL